MSDDLVVGAVKKASKSLQEEDRARQVDLVLELLQLVDRELPGKPDNNLQRRTAKMIREMVVSSLEDSNS